MKINLRETATFSMLSAIMLISKLLLEAIPNFHLLAVFTIAMTVVYRQKALYPIYLYVLLQGVIAGFNPWWVIHLYIWTVLWGVVMLLPRKMKPVTATVVYTIVCALHGLSYGVLSSLSQAPIFGLSFIQMVIAGIPFDLVHAAHNLILGMVLIMPIIMVLRSADKYIRN